MTFSLIISYTAIVQGLNKEANLNHEDSLSEIKTYLSAELAAQHPNFVNKGPIVIFTQQFIQNNRHTPFPIPETPIQGHEPFRNSTIRDFNSLPKLEGLELKDLMNWLPKLNPMLLIKNYTNDEQLYFLKIYENVRYYLSNSDLKLLDLSSEERGKLVERYDQFMVNFRGNMTK